MHYSEQPRPTQPTRMGCKVEAQLEYVHVACMFFARYGADLYAQTVLIKKNSASELRRKLTKSALLVGKEKT